MSLTFTGGARTSRAKKARAKKTARAKKKTARAKKATRNEPHLFTQIEDATEFFIYYTPSIEVHIGSGNYENESFEDGQEWVQKLFPKTSKKYTDSYRRAGRVSIEIAKSSLLNNLEHIASVLHDSDVFIEAEDDDLDLSIILCSSKDHPAPMAMGYEHNKIKATDIRLWKNMADRNVAQRNRKHKILTESRERARAIKRAARESAERDLRSIPAGG